MDLMVHNPSTHEGQALYKIKLTDLLGEWYPAENTQDEY